MPQFKKQNDQTINFIKAGIVPAHTTLVIEESIDRLYLYFYELTKTLLEQADVSKGLT